MGGVSHGKDYKKKKGETAVDSNPSEGQDTEEKGLGQGGLGVAWEPNSRSTPWSRVSRGQEESEFSVRITYRNTNREE